MGLKSPSKYLSLEKLQRIQKNYYKSDNGYEYVPEEVDFLINLKAADRANEQWDKRSRTYSTQTDSYVGFYA